MRNILMLASWYPTRNHPFNGDFIQRYAQCISLQANVTLLYCEKDSKLKKTEVQVTKVNPQLTEIIIFYAHSDSKSILSKIVSTCKYVSSLRHVYLQLRQTIKFDLVHLHVAYKAGLFALFLKRVYGLPFLISEQRSYFMRDSGGFAKRSALERMITRKVYEASSGVQLISEALRKALQKQKLLNNATIVLPNVVDTTLFKPTTRHNGDECRFIHVSSLVWQKNPDGMLRALKMVAEKRTDFRLRVVGPFTKRHSKLSADLGLQNVVEFLGELSYPDVAKEVAAADAMIFFTRFESFGCVIAESLCCGVPVICSDLEVTRELVIDGENGILVINENEKDLAAGIHRFLENRPLFNQESIAVKAIARFNYQSVAPEFSKFYRQIIPSRP